MHPDSERMTNQELVYGQLHAPECPYREDDGEDAVCTCPQEQLAARWKARWLVEKVRTEQAAARAADAYAEVGRLAARAAAAEREVAQLKSGIDALVVKHGEVIEQRDRLAAALRKMSVTRRP